jgi:predicted dehydrogenase
MDPTRPHLSNSGETRRGFLKKSAAAAAALAGAPLLQGSLLAQNTAAVPVSSVAAPAAPAAGERIVLGFIGHGSQGMSLLRAARRQAGSANVSIGGVCDLWHKRREAARVAAELPEAAAYDDYRRLLDRKDIDAVVIATPTHTHTHLTLEALDAGKHVYVEKPMTRYFHESFQIYDKVKSTGLKLQVGMQGCSHVKWKTCAEIIRSGGIGPLVLAQASYMRNSGSAGEWNTPIDPEFDPASVNWEVWRGPVPRGEFTGNEFFRWRKYYPYSAGIFGELLPHRVGPMLLATGDPEFPSRVSCIGTRKIQTDRDIRDNIQVLVEFPSGLCLLLRGSSVNEQGLPEVIRGHHGTLSIGSDRITLNPERPFSDEVDPRVFADFRSTGNLAEHQANWFNAIRTGVEPSAGAELAVRLETVLTLAEMSDRLNITCLFDEKTRTVTTGEGVPVVPLDYEREAALHVSKG